MNKTINFYSKKKNVKIKSRDPPLQAEEKMEKLRNTGIGDVLNILSCSSPSAVLHCSLLQECLN